MALAVGVSLAGAAPGAVHAAPAGSPSGAVADDPGPQAPADQVTAMRKAHLSKQRVEIVSQRTESSQTFAEPDGTITQEATPRPARVHASDGSWAAVDTSLTHDANGGVSPASTSAGLRFSGGGDGPMATIVSAGKSLSLQWPHGSLPAPSLEGSSATYAEVLPGVDLRLTAMVDGFSEVLVIKTRQAADNPDLASLRLGLAVDGVSVSVAASGVLTAMDGDGATVFGAPAALMWDSSDPSAPVTNVAKHAAAPAQARTARVDTSLDEGGDGLTLIPDPGMLTDPDTVFPVFVDPDVSTSLYTWTYVDSQFGDQAYMSKKGRSDAPAGRYTDTKNGGEYIQRSYIRFKFAKSLANTKVVSAEFRAYSHYQWNGTPTDHLVHAYSTSAPSEDTTWNHQPSHYKDLGAHSVKAGTWVGFNATAAVQQAADNDWLHLAFELKADDESSVEKRETYSMTDSTQPKLAVTIDHKPNTPTGLKMSPCYKACSSPATVSSKYPTMYASVSDPDGGNLKVVKIEVYTADGATKASYTYNTLTNIKSGGSIKWTSPSPRNLDNYKWHAQACDAYNWCSDWSSWFNFTVDTDNPTTPKVYSAEYPELVHGSNQWYGGVGQEGTFELQPNGVTGVVEYRYDFDRSPPGTVVAATNDRATVKLTPSTDGVHWLYVQSVDRAGNVSEQVGYEFGVASAPGKAGEWTFDEGSGTTAADTSDASEPGGPTNRHPVTLNNGTSWVPGHVGDYAVAMNGTDQYATSDTAVIDTTGGATGGGFTVSAWAYLDDNSRYHTVLSQDGQQSSAFYLQYRSDPDCDCWAFGMRDADTADGVTTVALSQDKAWLQEWTHLVGVYDAVNHQLRLYVNGVLQPDQPSFSSPIASTSPLNIGRGLHGGQIGWYWQGEVDNVRAYQRVMSDPEITHQAAEADYPELVTG
ncbi:LamG-like jellyroll fold domain-containing protein [Actinocatenispora comari]|uniref:LamG-like jellyroll fold domain-containing protein n=1 Tax=Actinocatenispora comari TaxID=2807577 RepID=UPI001A92A082|nr:LamG-like jellyroll fold domain-containing protein [Actinocatenispora comari]